MSHLRDIYESTRNVNSLNHEPRQHESRGSCKTRENKGRKSSDGGNMIVSYRIF